MSCSKWEARTNRLNNAAAQKKSARKNSVKRENISNNSLACQARPGRDGTGDGAGKSGGWLWMDVGDVVLSSLAGYGR